MTFGIAVNRAPFQNTPIYKLFETRSQKIAGVSDPLLKVIEPANAAECFPQDKEAPPFPN